MIVMRSFSILLAMAVAMYQKSIVRSKETVLRQNLFTLRVQIDEYTYDKAKAPQSLQDLVSEGYLRQIPTDPITEKPTGPPSGGRRLQRQPDRARIFDVHSKSDRNPSKAPPTTSVTMPPKTGD